MKAALESEAIRTKGFIEHRIYRAGRAAPQRAIRLERRIVSAPAYDGPWAIGESMLRIRRANTLVELLIVVAIIAVVISIILATFAKVYKVIESWK
jgi:hypothetical protein